MGRFFFFTDIDSVNTQTDADAFGPVVGSAQTQFRVTSIHKPMAGKTPAAYAVCDGRLLVQDVGTDLVNLILAPDDQPPFAFPKIKFFVYRGIKKSTLVTSNLAGESIVAPPTTNDLTREVWNWQQARNARQGKSDDAPAESLGLGFTGNGSIDDLFYQHNSSYEIPPVKSGWSLGNFNATKFGFEIMVEAVGFDPKLSLVRTSENVINVPALATQHTQAQEFEFWHDKEAILNYIDPCAFFGGFCNALVQRLYPYPLMIKHAGGSVSPEKGNGIYDNVLKGAHLPAPTAGVFRNRKRTYLDIRNEFNHSLNYFKNYGTSYSNTEIKCAFKEGIDLTVKNYYETTWPLMVIDNNDLPANNTSTRNIIRFALPDATGDNPFPTLYVSAGYLSDLYPLEPMGKEKLVDLKVSSGFADEVALTIPNHADQGSTRAISSYIKLKYFKRIDPTAAAPPVSSGTVFRARSFLDYIFLPFDMRIPFSSPGSIVSTTYDAEVFVDMSRTGGYDYVGEVGVYDEGTTFTFFLSPQIVRRRNDPKNGVVSLSGGTHAATEQPWTLIASELAKKTVQRSNLEFKGTPASIKYVKLVDENDDEPLPYNEPIVGFQILSCSKSRLLGIDKSSFTSKSPIYLGAHNLARYADELGQQYWNFNVSLNGYKLNGDSLEVHEVVSDISIYVYGNLDQGEDIRIGAEETTVLASSLPIVPAVPPITHVFVLMLENRSFDHMLGFAQISGKDAVTGQDTKVFGASSLNTNPFGTRLIGAKTPADFRIDESSDGPPHEFLDVLRQLCGTGDSAYDRNVGVYPHPDNQGFIDSYASGVLEEDGKGPSEHPDEIMNCFAPAQLPILTRLAREYAVCDHWYSSLPGPTWPNRFFAHAGTSGGLADSPGGVRLGASIVLPVKGFKFEHGHIYDRLSDRNMDWRIYEDTNPQVYSLEGMNYYWFVGNTGDMATFDREVNDKNFAPFYCFIEPNHGYIVKPFSSDNGQFFGGTAQHPRDDVRAGEMLIKQVYETIRNSPHWNNSVLVITYDEHGGFYDHVRPPEEAHPPADKIGYHTDNRFNFGRLGVRVPTVIISPLIPKGTIDHTRYDHTSILATLERMFRLEPMTERDKHANDFRHLFSLTIPRDTDAPRVLTPHPPTEFPGAAGPDTYLGQTDEGSIPPIFIQPPGGTPIKDRLFRPFIKFDERDLDLLLADPTLQPPTELADNRSPDLLAWLHVAFRRRLAVLEVKPKNLAAREKVFREYCAVKSVADAEVFIAKSVQEVEDFRARFEG